MGVANPDIVQPMILRPPDKGAKAREPIPIFGPDSGRSPFTSEALEQKAWAGVQEKDRLKARFEPSQPIGQDGPVVGDIIPNRGEPGYADYQRYRELKQEEADLLGLQMKFSDTGPRPIVPGYPDQGMKQPREVKLEEARDYLRYQLLKAKEDQEQWLRKKYAAQPLPKDPPTMPPSRY